MSMSFRFSDDDVEKEADAQDRHGDDTEVRRDELGFEHTAKQDHLWRRQRDHAHHEREHGAHRQTLVVQRLDERQHTGRVGVQRDTDDDCEWDTPPASRMCGKPVGGQPAMDRRTEPDPDQEVRPCGSLATLRYLSRTCVRRVPTSTSVSLGTVILLFRRRWAGRLVSIQGSRLRGGGR
jgi:hypothetical protein